ncbi:MAG: DNA primase [Candidatus Omnitrophota bacterium]
MSGRIPENILEDILSRVDIVEIISACIPLKRAGRNFKANCPFHQEKTPSFMVSPERQIYHCFGCGVSGNAFKFLMSYERMEFPEAAESLAKKAGVSLPQSSNQDSKATSLATELFKVNELSAHFYAHKLHSAEGARAKDYLIKRGISEASIKAFKIGFAPDSWDGLINHLRNQNISLGLIDKAGLVVNKDGGGYYDRFRNRIIFPIQDIKSRVLGFGARVLDNSLPKYINSPESLIYTKGKNLYGLDMAKESIRENDSAVIVEGYLDFIVPFQNGLRNITASLGTALTNEQAKLLKRYASVVTVVYDGDAAGELATLRSLDIFIEEEIQVKVVSLPKGFDPDSFVRKVGIEKLSEKIRQAEGLFDYKLKILKSRFDPLETNGKAKISAGMLETIAKFKNAVLKSEYLKRLAQELDVQEDALFQEIKKIKPQANLSAFAQPPLKQALSVNPTEKLLIKLMLEEVELVNRVKGCLQPEDFQDARVSRIVAAMFDLAAQGKSIEPRHLLRHLGDEDITQLICESMFMPQELTLEHKEKVVVDCLQRLKMQRQKNIRERLHDRIKIAQTAGDEAELQKLIAEFNYLVKKE